MGIGNTWTALTLASLLVVITASVVGKAPFASQAEPLTGEDMLANARSAARNLDSYVAIRSAVETTVHVQNPDNNTSVTRIETFEVASIDEYRVDQPAFQSEQIRIGNRVYRRYGSGEWVVAPRYDVLSEEPSLPGEVWWPPAHPMHWLEPSGLTNAQYIRQDEIDGNAVHVVSAQWPMLPAPAGSTSELPADELIFFIDVSTHHLLRVEIEENILDSLREDSGYQVIPGVVEINTTNTYDYSRHNDDIKISASITSSSA